MIRNSEIALWKGIPSQIHVKQQVTLEIQLNKQWKTQKKIQKQQEVLKLRKKNIEFSKKIITSKNEEKVLIFESEDKGKTKR